MRRSLSILALALLAGCGESPIGSTPPVETPPVRPDTALSFSSISRMTPGGMGTLTGKNLSKLTVLSIAGATVSFQRTSETEVQFQVPVFRQCETDGRPVDLVGNGGAVKVAGRVSLPNTVHLEVGESRVLSAEDLTCLQFGASRDEDYLLSATNLSKKSIVERLFRFRTLTEDQDTAQVTEMPALGNPTTAWAEQPRGPKQKAPYAGNPWTKGPVQTLDPRYATAKVGDTIQILDWARHYNPGYTPMSEAPRRPALVLAIAGNHVIIADAALPDIAQINTPGVREKLRKAAAIADRMLTPTMQNAMDPDFRPLQGSGGRQFSILRTSSFSGELGSPGPNAEPQSVDPVSSETMMVYLNPQMALEERYSPGQIASVILHENAHVVDWIYHKWGLGHVINESWTGEAWASLAEETAARLASGRTGPVKFSELNPETMPIPIHGMEWPSGINENLSPWGNPYAMGVGSGPYSLGMHVLLYVRDKLGESGPATGKPTLYQRLAEKGDWDIDAIAAQAGMTAEQLIDAYALADMTDDLLPPEIAAARGLPQVASWDNTRRYQNVKDYMKEAFITRHLLPRHMAVRQTGNVAGGSYNHWYVPVDEGKGLSLRFEDVKLAPHHKVRLTRLR